MAPAQHHPTEIYEVDDQCQRHQRHDADQQHVNPVGAALGRGIGRLLFHAADGDADA